jgi:hypothetical protein
MSVRFQVLIAANIKMTVFWVVAPCSLVEVYQRFRDPCCLHHQGDQGGTTQKTAIFRQECIQNDCADAIKEYAENTAVADGVTEYRAGIREQPQTVTGPMKRRIGEEDQ